MNADRTTETTVEAWLADGFTATPDVETMLDGVHAGVAATPQRRHRWWPLGRTAAAPVPESGPAPARGFTMFSAVKFIAASVIVALFGGFLLTGALTQQPSDDRFSAAVSASPASEATLEPTEAATSSRRTDILPGVELTVEEVEPGVLKVLNDGVRTWFGGHTDFSDIVAGHDGSILLVEQGEETPRRRGSFSRLGSDESFSVPTYGYASLAVSPDGTVWASGPRNDRFPIYSLTDGNWTRRLRTADSGGPHEFTVAPDGTIWVAIVKNDEKDMGRLVIRRLGADGWQRVGEAPFGSDLIDSGGGNLVVTEGGVPWWVPGDLGHSFDFDDDGSWRVVGGGSLSSLHTWKRRGGGSEWFEVTTYAPVYIPGKLGVELGADGTVWLAGVNPLMVDAEPVRSGDSPFAAPAESFVMRYDGTGWQRWGPDDGVPSLTWSHPQLEQDPDGGLWVVAQPDPWYMPEDAADPPFDGIAHFDGSTWQYFLAGHDVDDWDIAPDSSVWLRADGAVYAITPEAVAAAE